MICQVGSASAISLIGCEPHDSIWDFCSFGAQERSVEQSQAFGKRSSNRSRVCWNAPNSLAAFRGPATILGQRRFEELCEQGGAETLMALGRKKALPRNRVPEHGERAATERTVETPAPGQKRASWELWRKGGAVSPSGVRSIRPRNDSETTKMRPKVPETAKRHKEADCHLPANFRHPCPRGDPQALHREDGDRRRRPVEPCRTTGRPLLCRKWRRPAAHPDRGTEYRGKIEPRLPTLSGRRGRVPRHRLP